MDVWNGPTFGHLIAGKGAAAIVAWVSEGVEEHVAGSAECLRGKAARIVV